MLHSQLKLRLELTFALLLGLLHLIQAVPTYDIHQPLRVRSDNRPRDDQLVTRSREQIPWGDGKDAIQWVGDEWWNEPYKEFVDYDPDQDFDFDEDKPSSLPKAPPKTGTGILRSIKIDDKSVRDAFIDQKKPEWVGFKAPNEEKLERTTRIEFFRSNTPLADPKPKPKGYRSWQADHVQDLGYFTCIASKENPEGVSETAWRTIQDAILGEEDENGDPQPTDDTKTLGLILNAPHNVLGISYAMNSFKNKMQTWAYSDKNQPPGYKTWQRSTVWGLYKYMDDTKEDFDEITKKSTDALKGLIHDDATSAENIQKYFADEINRIWNKANDELERILEHPPADDPKNDNVFKREDCCNTKNTADSPPPAPTPASPPTPPADNPPEPPPTVAKVEPAIPPAAPSCNPAPIGKYNDAHIRSMKLSAFSFCFKNAKDIVNSPTVDITKTMLPIPGSVMLNDANDDHYEMKITSIANCASPDGINLAEPVPGNKCSDIITKAWMDCNNKGRGGSINAGCLTYSIKTIY